MCRISPVSEDWADKGCHLHVGNVEVALRPNHLGGIVCRKVFSRTEAWELDAASKLVVEALQDPVWRGKLTDTIERAMVFLQGVEGQKRPRARGRLREFRMLPVALGRMEIG